MTKKLDFGGMSNWSTIIGAVKTDILNLIVFCKINYGLKCAEFCRSNQVLWLPKIAKRATLLRCLLTISILGNWSSRDDGNTPSKSGDLKYRGIFKSFIFLIGFFFTISVSLSAQITDTLQATKLLKSANQEIEQLNHQKAIEFTDQAIKIYETIGANDYRLGFAYNVKGDAYYEMGQTDKAMAYFINAENVLKAYYQKEHLEIAQSLNFLGLCHWRKGVLDQAAEYFSNALQMRANLLGDSHPKVADGYNNLGYIAYAKGEIAQALLSYQNALKIRVETLGYEHLDVAASLNNIGSCFSKVGQHDQALDAYQQALTIRENKLTKDHPKVAQTLMNMGDCYLQNEKIEKALSFFERALSILNQHAEMNELELAKVYNFLGSCYAQMGDQGKALPYFEKSLALQQANNEDDSPNLVAVYNNLANAFEKLGDYQKALVYYQNNLHILTSNPSFGDNHPLTALTYNNIGQTQVKFNDYVPAIQSHAQALRIFRNRNDRAQIAETYRHIGTVFLDAGNNKSAIQHFTASLNLSKELGLDNDLSNAYIFQNLAIGYFNQGQYDLALENYKKAHSITLLHVNHQHPILVPSKTGIGQALQKTGDYNLALESFDRALDILKIKPQEDDLPDFIESPIDILQLLLAKGNTHLAIYHQSKKQAALTTALDHFDYAIRLAQKVRMQYQEVQSKISLGELAYDNFAGAIKACYLLHQLTENGEYLESAFAYSEQSRSSLVLEALNTSSATAFSGIPNTLIQQERDLKVSITFYEKQKHTEEQKGPSANPDFINELNNKIFAQKGEYELLQQQFEKEFPNYFALKYEVHLPSISTIQEEFLTPDHTMLEYFVADSAVYAFVINQSAVTLTKLPVAMDDLGRKVSSFRNFIYGYYTNTNSQTGDAFTLALENYANLAFELFGILWQPVDNQLAEKVTVINGGVLNFLPFEALIANSVTNIHQLKGYSYLLNNHEISYGYSANLLHRIKKVNRAKPFKKLLTFAPEFSMDDTRELAPLVHNIPEVESIQAAIDGDVFVKAKATLKQFLDIAHLYQIIHLSTHGQSDMQEGDYSYLAFAESRNDSTEDLLYAKDIYNLSLNADMVVLSACETGKGQASRSEGAISLGRAFFYSGAKSILNTLWSVDDASTGKLMQQFYADIENGLPRSTALRNAKLNFIKEGKYAHPYYWSAFMLIGERETLAIGGSSNWWMMGGLTFLLVLSFLLFSYWRNRKRLILSFNLLNSFLRPK